MGNLLTTGRMHNPAVRSKGGTRRQMLARSVALATAFTLLSWERDMGATAVDGDDTIHQDLEFVAPPERVYEALLDEKQFSALTGATAEIDRNIGGVFRLFGGRVIGRNIELVPNRRIVQAWRAEIWPSGIYAIVRFELTANDSGTRLTLDEAGFPPENRSEHNVGWVKFYWNPLRKYLEA